MPPDPHSKFTVCDHQSGSNHQDDVLGGPHNGPQLTQLQPHYKKRCEDQLDKCRNDKEREYSVSRETMQTRKCRMVAEQLGSGIPQEQCKDVPTRKYSTTHEKVGDRPQQVTGMHTYSEITEEDLHSVTVM